MKSTKFLAVRFELESSIRGNSKWAEVRPALHHQQEAARHARKHKTPGEKMTIGHRFEE